MNPNNIVIVDFGYGTSVLIHHFMISVLHKGIGHRLKATILLEGRDSDGVFYHIKWVERPVGIDEWETVVPRRNVRRIIMMRIHNNNSDAKDGDNDE
eukprot:12986117-Ditylum_brightwellii.AAC.1